MISFEKGALNELEFFKKHPKNRVITHAVDASIYYFDSNERNTLRNKLNYTDEDVVILSLGSLTANKGIHNLLEMMHVIVNKLKFTKYKLLLKGCDSLYNSSNMLDPYINDIINDQRSGITLENMQYLFNNNYIKFTGETLKFDDMRTLYNSCDLYVSPYLAEGFALTPLEALACGRIIVVPMTGSSNDYTDLIIENVPIGRHYIKLIPSRVISFDCTTGTGKKYMNEIKLNDLVSTVIRIDTKYIYSNYKKNTVVKYIEDTLNWTVVADELMSYFDALQGFAPGVKHLRPDPKGLDELLKTAGTPIKAD